MLLITGQRMCGRVDHVPGTCYVATRFLHLYYVPLIPLSSWVIRQGTEKLSGFDGQQIRMSIKSVLFGWLQAYLVVFGLINSLRGPVQIAALQHAGKNPIDGEITLALGLLSLGVWLLFRFRPLLAGAERANELRARLGIDPLAPDADSKWTEAA